MGGHSLCWVLLQSLVSENVVSLVAELHVVHKVAVIWHSVVSLYPGKLSLSELDLLSVENTSEFLCSKVALSEDVKVMEEFLQSDSVSLNNVLHLCHQLVHVIGSLEVSEFGLVGGLGTCGRFIHHILKTVGIPQELSILYFIVLVAIDQRQILHI